MFTCAQCAVKVCRTNELEKMPKNCPMHDMAKLEKIKEDYLKPELHEFTLKAAQVECEGYCQWSRVEETIRFAKAMGYKRIGIAFCIALKKEAKVLAELFQYHGLEVSSVVCKCGAFPKESIGIPKEHKLKPEEFEPICNPIAQAKLLEEDGCEFLVLLGLCVGHDSLFIQAATKMVTVLASKDRVLANNPLGAIYCAENFYNQKLHKEIK